MEKVKISYKNIWRWFADQLSHPATLFKRKSWGVFSEYAHVRRSDRMPKKASPNKEKALEAAAFMANKYGGSYSIYKCVYCDGWHIAKDPESKSEKVSAANPDLYRIKQGAKNLDVEKILASGIPDIAQVYGGVRGRTLSSPAQAYAWSIVKECGIRTIIDLREDGIYTHMQRLCDKFGMEYFYYPVDKKVKHVGETVRLFPKLCRIIDEGNFYIACAMGLHRTDIALCAYWMFYAADRGVEPPAIRGYRKVDGHDTSKIMRVLNAMYKEFTTQNGTAPIPMTVYNERKKIIESQSAVSDD